MYAGLFLCQNMFLISNGNQLTSADIGLAFVNLKKIKHMRNVFHSVLVPEFKFEVKNMNFQKLGIFLKIWRFHEILKILDIFQKLLFLSSISNSRTKTERKTCLISLIFFKSANSSPLSADVSWFTLDFKIIFWHEKKPTYSHKQGF